MGAGKGWCSEENVLACKSYLAHSTDPEKGSGKKLDVFHKLVEDTYMKLRDELVTQEPLLRDRMHPRTGRAIAQRYKKRIRAECLAIETCVARIKQQNPTGNPSEEDILRFAVAVNAGTPMSKMYEYLRNPERVSLIPSKWLNCLRYLRSTAVWEKTRALATSAAVKPELAATADGSSDNLAAPNGPAPIAPHAPAPHIPRAVPMPQASLPVPLPGAGAPAAAAPAAGSGTGAQTAAGPANPYGLAAGHGPMRGAPGASERAGGGGGGGGVFLAGGSGGLSAAARQRLGMAAQAVVANGMQAQFGQLAQARGAVFSAGVRSDSLLGQKRPLEEPAYTSALLRCAAGMEELAGELAKRNKISAEMLNMEKQKNRIQLFSMPGTSPDFRDRFLRMSQESELREMEAASRPGSRGDVAADPAHSLVGDSGAAQSKARDPAT